MHFFDILFKKLYLFVVALGTWLKALIRCGGVAYKYQRERRGHKPQLVWRIYLICAEHFESHEPAENDTMNESLAHNHATADSQEPHRDFEEPPPPVWRVLGYHKAENIAHHRNVGLCNNKNRKA